MNQLGLNGAVLCTVLRGNMPVRATRWQKNLILDAGLDRMATMPICDTFLHCCAGIGALSNDASQKTGTYDVNTAGLATPVGLSDAFTSGEQTHLFRFQVGLNTVLYSRAVTESSGNMTFSPAPAAGISGASCYRLRNTQTGLGYELARTANYSADVAENRTTGSVNYRDHERGFVFPSFTFTTESPDTSASATGGTATKTAGTRVFKSQDVGKTIFFTVTGETGTISAIGGGGTTCTISNGATISGQPIKLVSPSTSEAVSGTYKQDNGSGAAGTTLTRVSGSRDFTDTDIGKTVRFAGGAEGTIASITSNSVAVLTTSRLNATETITIYGYVDVTEIGFSHTGTVAANINIRIPISGNLRVKAGTPSTPSEQLKVNYRMRVAVEPAAVTASAAMGSIISGGFNLGNFTSVIETVMLSSINPDGTTNISTPQLEPYYAPILGLSTDATALAVNQPGRVRDQNIVTASSASLGYTAGARSQEFQASFPVGQAVRSDWRSAVVYHPDSHQSAFSLLFSQSQTKESSKALTLSVIKRWDYNGNL